MTSAPPAPHALKMALRKHQVESKLDNLRQRHRLAIHINEKLDTGHYIHCPDTWDYFIDDAKDISQKLPPIAKIPTIARTVLPLPSLSLLPAGNKTIRPYGIGEKLTATYGYLVDLDQSGEAPARVVMASEIGLNSGYRIDDKCYWGKYSVCSDIYRGFNHYDWLNALAGPQGAELTSRQLDTLGNYYNHAKPQTGSDPNIFDFNEILVAAAKQHITAIVVPVFNYEGDKGYKAHAQLIGALTGLSHLDKGIKLPVVLYHVSPSKGTTYGACTFIGEERKELTDMALSVIRDLQRHKYTLPQNIGLFAKPVREVLGIDLDVPLAKQKGALAELEKKCAASAMGSPP